MSDRTSSTYNVLGKLNIGMKTNDSAILHFPGSLKKENPLEIKKASTSVRKIVKKVSKELEDLPKLSKIQLCLRKKIIDQNNNPEQNKQDNPICIFSRLLSKK